MTKPLLSPHTLVVDENRRWIPDWYAWLLDVKNSVTSLTGQVATNTSAIATNTSAIAALQTVSPAGLIYGLGLSNNVGNPTTQIDIAAGRAAANSSFATMILAGALTKRLDATWVVGTNNGGLDTGSASDGVYYVHLIARSDTGVVDALFSLSATAPTMPTSYDRRRRVGSIRRLGGVILAFTQSNNRFIYVTPIIDANTITFGTSRTLVTTSVPPNMLGLFRGYTYNAASRMYAVLQPTSETDAAPDYTASPGLSLYSEVINQGSAGHFDITVDSSSQIAARASVASSTLTLVTRGWIDEREIFG